MSLFSHAKKCPSFLMRKNVPLFKNIPLSSCEKMSLLKMSLLQLADLFGTAVKTQPKNG
jgi:hypothetical protein